MIQPGFDSSYITGEDIVVAPLLTNERHHHLLQKLAAKEHIDEFLDHFR